MHPRAVVARVPEPLVVADLVAVRAVRHRVAVAVGVVVAAPRVLSVAPVARPDVAASRRSSVVKSSTRCRRPAIGGVRVKQGDGQKVRLARGASLTDLAEKIGVDASSLVQVLFHLGEMVTATQSVSDDTLQVLGTELNYDIEVVSPEDEDRELLESFDIEFGENERRRGGSRSSSAGRHRDGSRRPRQDQAAGRDPQDQRRGPRGRWHHPGHRRLPGGHRGRRRGAQDHLHRHPGSRGVHRHACPWREVDRHRRAGGGGRRRCDAADDRGAQPRLGGRSAGRRRGEQDRQGRVRIRRRSAAS